MFAGDGELSARLGDAKLSARLRRGTREPLQSCLHTDGQEAK